MKEKEYLLNSQIVVHAGGLGERWRPVNGERPKPLTPVGKFPRPMIEWVILPWIKAGVKKFFISAWHKSGDIELYSKNLEKRAGIKIEILAEPPEKRLGRAGVIKFGLENEILDENRPIVSMNASDIIRINIPELIKYHLNGLKKGFYLTVVGASVLPTTFGVISILPNKKVKKFVEKPLIKLKNQFINTGLIVIDSKLNKVFKEIRDEDLPLDLESTSNKTIKKFWKKARVYLKAIPWKNWIYLKDLKDYRKVEKIDLEKFLGIPAEQYLGKV
jgi:NDP-sugar pyrophosphorylase family protein